MRASAGLVGVAPLLRLEAIAELIGPVMAHLQEHPDAVRLADALAAPLVEDGRGQPVHDEGTGLGAMEAKEKRELRAEEFAEFLQRRGE